MVNSVRWPDPPRIRSPISFLIVASGLSMMVLLARYKIPSRRDQTAGDCRSCKGTGKARLYYTCPFAEAK